MTDYRTLSSPFRKAIDSWKNRPFVRGESDCCAFVDHVIFSVSGKHFLPEYIDDESAQAILDCFRSGLEGAVTHYMKRDPTDDPKPPDVVLIRIPTSMNKRDEYDEWLETLGVLMDEKRAATVFEDGSLRDVSARWVTKGWSWA